MNLQPTPHAAVLLAIAIASPSCGDDSGGTGTASFGTMTQTSATAASSATQSTDAATSDAGTNDGADRTLTIPPTHCPNIPVTPSPHGKSATVNVQWSLVSFSRRHHRAVISFQPPCGTMAASHASVRVTRLRHHRVRIAVTMRVPVPAASCPTLLPVRRITVRLPRRTSAAALIHAR